MNSVRNDIRNVAIIAHVDHGKTTMVDALLRQSGNFRESQLQGEAILDSNPLERERGVTILAKNVAINYTDPDTKQTIKINLIDTPGHADFGGEVERVLSMADGVFLLVDAAEGPLPQTRFVLKKAFQHELRPIVVINKIDRPDARPDAVLDEVFDLFVDLGADDETLDFPTIYASGREGIAKWRLEDESDSIRPLFEAIIKHIPAPHGDDAAPLQMRITSILYNDYVGRIGVGRIYNGVVRSGQTVVVVDREGKQTRTRVAEVHEFEGFGRRKVESARAGDIVALIGLETVDIGNSICDPVDVRPLEPEDIEPPTLTMMFSVNDSPFAGREGKFVTSRNIRERLMKELESNVALRVEETENKDAFKVSGRGLMHLGVLIETMRREGFELSVGKPQVIMKKVDGKLLEPIEYLVVDVPEVHQGAVMQLVGTRKGELVRMDNRGGQVHMEFTIPARGLIGLRTRMLTATQGQAVMHHNFHEYAEMRGEIASRPNGVLVSMATGKANEYALNTLQDRGTLFIRHNDEVYEGQIVGENARENDLVVNPTTAKKLTNMRSTGSDENILLRNPRVMTLEQALEYIEDDEVVEVTPTAVRLRKAILQESQRRKVERSARKAGVVET
ncbi:MAG: translational GTPase TypA [Tepidisphaerales bacterium]